jgi:hypothetical protein
MYTGPQVDRVPLPAATGLEALEDVLTQVNAEGAAPRVAAVQGAGPAPLQAAAAQPCAQTQVVEHALQR